MENVDDSDGYYGGEFEEALEKFANSIQRASLHFKQKKNYITYLFEKYLANDPDYFQEHYGKALDSICETKEDLEYWRDLLRPHLPASIPNKENWFSYYQAKESTMMYLSINDMQIAPLSWMRRKSCRQYLTI